MENKQNKKIDALNKEEEDWKNLKPDDMVRGIKLNNIEERCLKLASCYIGGSWENAKTTSDIIVKRISGGFTNQLYHVQLSDSVPKVNNYVYPDEPSDIAIKFYLEKHIKNYSKENTERLNDMIILTIMSQTGLGPKIYGIFENGFIQKFYKHEQFRAKHQQTPKLLKDLAQVIAKIHHLNVPINKKSNLLFDEMRNMIHFAYKECQVEELVNELNLETFKSHDLREEFDYLITLIDSLKSPVVFCHNDFRGSNILVVEPEDKVLTCDLEYCGYGSRAYDLATFLTEWNKTEMFQISSEIPTDDELTVFLKLYIEQCDILIPGYSSDNNNSLKVHIKETKIMILANFMFFLAVMVKTTESIIPAIKFDAKKKMVSVENMFKMYMAVKQQFIKDGTI